MGYKSIILSTIILVVAIMQGCAVNKKSSTEHHIEITDTTTMTKKDTTAFNNKSESVDKSVEESNLIIEEVITESIVDSVNHTTTNRTTNRTIHQTYNKNNDITSADTTSMSHSTIDTLKNISTEHINTHTTEVKKETQSFKWIFLIALIALIIYCIKKFS